MIAIIVIIAVLNCEIVISKAKTSASKANDDCHLCGFPAEETEQEDKIIANGTSVKDPGNAYPWMVAIYRKKVFLCSGFIVSKQYILTAAHCLSKGSLSTTGEMDPAELVVELAFDGGKPEEMKLDRLYLHPDFLLIKGRFEHDIALMHLKKELKCSERAYPICISEKDKDNMGKKLTIAGFGHIRDEQRKEKILKANLTLGHVKQVESKICTKAGPNTGPAASILCGVSGDTKQIFCEGDSGGPIFGNFEGVYYALGVISSISGGGPCVSDSKSAYSKIYYYKEWIKKNLGELPVPKK